ncbi:MULTISPECIES: ribulose-phosphate 3-epimerase [Neokomagataea]|uniref:Ribulose-phosphate 3-epimerase n=2 Tax=Neokomagataea TaxID=1223423 RepID=A0ABQ0QFT0_9PROT|nr:MULTISPECIES: ribulose-phosphate 3-epimerase [Neokomagataea]MBR0558567.1 ribulose-phosphate 3-epimerase [Neokomagataea anthophila]GBR43227.1 ribulose-phosphate 3-epimerase [Neokomagataea tanensis NBRC 106556]
MTDRSPILVAPSLLAADYGRLAEETRSVARAPWLHLDVMDGHFVPNISFGPPIIAALPRDTGAKFDVHLMIDPVDPYLEATAKAGADHITVHIENAPHVHRTLQTIKALGCRPGIALCPATPPEAVSQVLDLVDIILVMTVNPGFGGQKFLESQLPKIRKLAEMIKASGRDIVLGVDGGIGPETAAQAVAAGATMLVAGSSVFGKEDRDAAIAALEGPYAE